MVQSHKMFLKQVVHFFSIVYYFCREQKRSLTLDIITGFHVIDGSIHLLVLEGLQDGAMKRLLEEMNFDKKDGNTGVLNLYLKVGFSPVK